MTEIDKRIPVPFSRLEALFYKMPKNEEDQPSIDRRTLTLEDNSKLIITRVESSAQKSFGVLFQGIYFSIIEDGLQHVSFPNINIHMANQTVKVEVRPFSEFKEDPIMGADILVNWVQESVRNNKAKKLPFGISFAQ